MKRLLLALAFCLAAPLLRGQALIPYYLYLQPFSGGSVVAVGGGYTTIQEEGVALPVQTTINCIGAGITCADGSGVTTLTVSGAAAAYATVQDEGTPLTQFTTLNCVGAGIVCSNGASKTTITVAGAAGAVNLQGSYPGTPDTGNANITGTYGSTQNNIHAVISNFGLSLENNQAALVGQTREYSPAIRFVSSAWDTDGAVANTNSWQVLGRPLNGNTTSVDLAFYASLAGGAYSQKMALDSAGKLTLGEAGVSVGAITLNNATSGTITIQPTTGALGTVTLTAPAANGTLLTTASTQTRTIILKPQEAQFLASAFPQFVIVAGSTYPVASLKYDGAGALQEEAFWQIDPVGYVSGNVTARIYWYADSGTSGDVIWGCRLAAITPNTDTQDIETDGMDTAATVTDSHLGTTAQRLHSADCVITATDSLAADDVAFVGIYRDGDAAGDTMNSIDAQVVLVRLSYLGSF